MAKAKDKKKKIWIKIIAPREFHNKPLGETLQREKLSGRKLKVSLSNLIGDFKKQNTSIGFVVTEVKDNQAKTEVYKYIISPSHLKRLVRKSKNKIDDSFVVETKDKIKLRVKPFMVTRQKTSRSTLTSLRKISREQLERYIKGNTFVDFIRDVISGKIQGRLKYELKIAYPLSLYEIRCIERVK